jgi:hypothetical protein
MAYALKKGHILAIAGGIVVILGVVAVVLLMQNRSDEYTRHTLSETKANAPVNPAACTAKSDDPNLKISASEQTDIFNAVVTSITDIPAGTEVNVYVASYDNATTNGSIVYAGDYGSYNFTATKQSGAWRVKTFEMCS